MSSLPVAVSTPLITIAEDTTECLATHQDALAQADRLEMTVQPQGWAKPVRIRTLTGAQRQKVNRHAGVGAARDWEKFVVMTLVEGVTSPPFSPSSAKELFEFHNGELVEQLAIAIWELGRVDGSAVNAFLTAEKDLRAAEQAQADGSQ